MERRSRTVLTHVQSIGSNSARAAASALSSTDGRWALLSTSLTAMIAGSIAWLAVGTMPPINAQGFGVGHETTFLPYELFQRLVRCQRHAPMPRSRPSARSQATQQTPPRRQRSTIRSRPRTPATTATRTPASKPAPSRWIAATRWPARWKTPASPQMTRMPPSLRSARSSICAACARARSFELTYSTAQPEAASRRRTRVHRYARRCGRRRRRQRQWRDGTGDDDAGRPLLSVAFSPSVEHDVTYRARADGSFTANDVEKKLEAHIHRAGATINSSLYLAAMQAGIPADVVVEMIHMFSYKVDFQRDIKPGDTFEVFYNYYYTPDGQPAKRRQYLATRRCIWAAARSRSTATSPIRTSRPIISTRTARAPSRMLMKTPVDGARISSGFGMRFHPVLGYTPHAQGHRFRACRSERR